MEVILLGTGSPMPDAKRGGPATMVMTLAPCRPFGSSGHAGVDVWYDESIVPAKCGSFGCIEFFVAIYSHLSGSNNV